MKKNLLRLKYYWPLEAFYKGVETTKELGLRYGIEEFFNNLTYPFLQLISNIKRIIDYTPLLWKDRDWDHSYLMDMIQFKLLRIEKTLIKGHCEHNLHLMRDLRSMINLLKRHSKNDYNDMVFKDHIKKWGKLKFNFGKKIQSGQTYISENCVTRTKIKSKQDEEIEGRESQKLYKKVKYLEQQDLDFFFKLFRKRVESLWD